MRNNKNKVFEDIIDELNEVNAKIDKLLFKIIKDVQELKNDSKQDNNS